MDFVTLDVRLDNDMVCTYIVMQELTPFYHSGKRSLARTRELKIEKVRKENQIN